MEFAAVLSCQATLLRFSDNWTEFFEASKLESQAHFSTFILEEDRPLFQHLFSSLEKHQSVSQNTIKFVSSKSEIVSMHLKLSKVGDEVYLQAINMTELNNERLSLQKIAKLSSAGSWFHTPLNGRSFWSFECYAIFDLRPETRITGDMFYSFFLPPYEKTIKECVRKLYTNQEKYTHYGKIKTKKGEVKWIRTIAEPTVHEGEIIKVSGVSTDVTESQEFIETLKENERTKTLALQAIRSTLFFYCVKTDRITAGVEFAKQFGLDEGKSLTYNAFLQLVHPDDRAKSKERFMAQMDAGEGHYYNEYRMQMKNEEVAFCEVFAWKEIDEHGKVIRLIGNLINVNQRVEAEQRLNAKINQLEAVINNGFSYMLLLDKEGYILNLDEASRTLIKEVFSVDPKLNKVKLPDVIPHNLLGPFDTNFAQALKGEVVSDFVERTVKSGQTLSAQRIYKPILNEQSEIDSVLVILVDLT